MKNFKRLIKIMLKYKREHIIAFLFLIFESFGGIALPYFLVNIVDVGIADSNYPILIKMCIIYIIIAVLQNLSKGISSYLYSVIGGKVVLNIRKKLIDKVLHMSGSYYTSMKSGDVFSTISEDVGTIEQLCTESIFTVLTEIFMSLPLIIYLCYLDYRMFLIAVILQPIYIFVQNKVSKSIAKYSVNIRESYGDYASTLQELLYNPMNSIKSKSQIYLFNKIIDNIKINVRAYIKLNFSLSRGQICGSLMGAVSSIITILMGGILIIDGKLSMGILLAFLQYSSKILSPILGLGQFNMQYKNARVSLTRIFDLLDSDGDRTYYIGKKNEGIDYGEVCFQNVKFSYGNAGFDLSDLNLKFEPGKMSAIVGSSGSGKTSVINLLYRLWEVDEGNILIDNINLNKFNIEYLRENISLVSQEIVLLNDTVYNNIVLENRDISLDTVMEASKAANIYDTIIMLENGFDTIIGDRGIRLSGGQKQRLSIARAIVKQRPIIVFDEATSALDNINEFVIYRKLFQLFKEKTIIVIAHRLTTIEKSDIIYVMENGKVVEEGTHDSLLSKGGTYYKLYHNESKNAAVER